MNLHMTSKGAYLASLLACLPNIDSVASHQNLKSNALQFDQYGMPGLQISLRSTILELYNHVKVLYLNANKYDWRLSSWVLSKLPSADQKNSGHITPKDRLSRICAINARAVTHFSSDSASKMTKSELLDTMDPDSIIRIHSASDEGAASIQTQPNSPDSCFLRLGIQISPEDVNCPEDALKNKESTHG